MIGIDIGTRYIKMCCLRKNEDGLFLVCARMAARPVGVRDTYGAVSNLLRKMTSGRREDGCIAASSMGGASVAIRNFSLPALSGKDLENAVQFESEQVADDSASVFQFSDFQALKSLESSKLEIMHVSVPADEAIRRVKSIERAGFELNVIDTDAFALTNCFLTLGPRDYRKKSVILIDIGHTWTTICALENGELRLVRSVAFGGECIAREIAMAYGITPEQAETIQRHPEIWADIGLTMKNVLKRSSPPLFEAVYRTIEYCMSKKILVNVDALLLSGGVSGLVGLDEFVSEVLDVKVNRWNPFNSVDYTEDIRADLGRYFTVAAGLSLRKEEHV